MKFLATFAHWVDTSQPGLEVIGPDDVQDLRFIIEARSEKKARETASRYEGIESNTHEGIGKLKSLVPVDEMPEDITSVRNIKAFDGWLRPRPVSA